MSLKTLFNKIVPGKKPNAEENIEENIESSDRHELPFEKLDTRIERIGSVGEIDIYINDEKNSIHTLASATKIGRDPSQSDIIISELIVSKLHCTIYNIENDFYIKDNDSTNGVYINNEKIESEQRIENGDVILLGKKGTVKIIFHKRR